MCHAARVHPERASVRAFGEVGGVQVWAAEGDDRVRASVLVSSGPPIVVLNRRLIGTAAAHDAVCWALATVAERGAGFYVLRAD